MAYVKQIMQRSPGRATVKITCTAQTDTPSIYLKSAVTTTTGNVTFVLPAAGAPGGSIVRASGSWLTDFTSATFSGGGGLNALGQYVYQVTALANVANRQSFNIIGFATTSTANDTAIISQYTPVRVAEGPLAVTANSYYSDLLCAGQTAGATPAANITKVWASTVTGGGMILTRNSVVALQLFGGGGVYGGSGDTFQTPLTENNTSDVALTLQSTSTTGGSTIIEFAKVGGFSAVDVNPI